jgi:(4S)-4-hydroxy-5-phosphonooxypentane-2,3-dione isomerase
MVVTSVLVQVKPDSITKFIDATVKNHEASLKERGNLRFDVLQNSDDPSLFMLYEVYETDDAAAAHKKTAHYLEWKKIVEDMMQKPRQGVPYTVIRPQDKKLWR